MYNKHQTAIVFNRYFFAIIHAKNI